jgi:very-short-patch-repair endonuclease
MYHELARELRRQMTPAEVILWQSLRNNGLGFRFRRQAPIGRYIVDFLCRDRRLVVELDGGHHAESAHDRVRDEWLSRQGCLVLRFWNTDVYENVTGVLEEIGEQAARRETRLERMV